MSNSKAFIIFLIPVIILAMGIWTLLSAQVDRGDVRVGGALIGNAEVDMAVSSCRMSVEDGTRKLRVELDAENASGRNVSLVPNDFTLVLTSGDSLTSNSGHSRTFNPMRYSSACEAAPGSSTLIPPGAVRSITLVFWGENMPRGDEWGDYLLSLEYYDAAAPLMMSTLLSPAEE